MSKFKKPNVAERVQRSFTLAEINANATEAGNIIEGQPAVYGQETVIAGIYKEIIEPGAFNRTNFDDVLFSINHDLDKIPLARSRRNNGSSTLHLTTNESGMHIRANLDVENNSEAKALYSAVSRGDIDGMSFIFYVGDDSWEGLDTDMPTRRIKSIARVIEVSAVTFPAYAGTDISARNDDPLALDNAKQALANARSSLIELDNSALEVERLKTQILLNLGGN